VDLLGKSLEEAEELAKNNACHLEISGEGEKVISVLKKTSDSLKVFLSEDRILSMPELKGLSLKDALGILGESNIPVEFVGKGRIVEQNPKANTKLERGQVCKLVLKEDV
jgi:cell division protein FtsI (penicillin-binding protein 3)/stage V sporulation protein D (sporulation-specific penicillin-binding protein)